MSFPSRSSSGDDHVMDHRRTNHVPNASPNQQALLRANHRGDEAVIDVNERPRANPFLDEDEQEMHQLIDQLVALTDEPGTHFPPGLATLNTFQAIQPPEQQGKT